MARETIEIAKRWKFGKPTLISRNNGKARWDRGSTSPLDQKSPTGWLANLYGGVQTNDDYARVEIPVDEMLPSLFMTALWTYYQTNAEVYGVNMVIWLHDPTDNDKRVEVTQAPSGVTLEKGAGWNAHELNTSTVQFFYFGENVAGSGLTAGTQYTWAQFQTDVVFRHWTIYKITLEWGWYSTGTFEDAWVADIKLNNDVILLGPDTGMHKKTVLITKTLDANGAYSIDDVISDNPTNGQGTDWDIDFGGTGYITKAVIAHATTAITPRVDLQLYTRPPTCELDDHAASTGPIAADLPFFLGVIEFPALKDAGTSTSYATVTPSTVGNAPLAFDAPKIYGVTVTRTATDFADDTLLSILLTAEMEDN